MVRDLMTNEAKISRQFYEDVALQAYYLSVRRKDIAFEEHGGRQIYAIDSNIISLCAEPDANATRGSRKKSVGVGDIFRSDHLERAEAVATSLADFITFRLGGDRRFMLIPPIEREVAGMFTRYMGNFPSRIDQESVQKGIARLSHLLTKRGLQTAIDSKARALGQPLQPEFYRDRGRAYLAHERLRRLWRDRFDAIERKKTSQSRADAAAMAHLEMLNAAAIQSEKAPRILYVTMDSSLHDAGNRYELPDSEETFTERFLRHPRCYLDEPAVLSPVGSDDDEDASSLVDFFEIIDNYFDGQNLPRPFEGSVEIPTKVIRQLTKSSDLRNDVLDRWGKFEGARVATTVPNAESWNNIEQAWDSLLAVGVAARYAMELHTHSVNYDRSVPIPVLEGRPVLTQFIEKARSWQMRPNTFSIPEYTKFRSDVDREDETRYGFYLAHSFLLALKGQWETAQSLAERALERTNKSESAPTKSNGREALLLLSICQRHTARTSEDLDGLERRIDRVEQIYRHEKSELELERKAGKSVWPHDIVPERFDTERLALKYTRYRMQIHEIGQHADDERVLDSLETLQNQMVRLAKRVTQRLRRLAARNDPENEAPAYYSLAENRIRALERTRGRLFKNILAIHLEFGVGESAAKKSWQELLNSTGEAQYLRERLASKKRKIYATRYPSTHLSILLYAATVVFSDDRTQVARAWRELEGCLRIVERSRSAPFPYDAVRYENIRDRAYDEYKQWPNMGSDDL